jgi:hypothetical protein
MCLLLILYFPPELLQLPQAGRDKPAWNCGLTQPVILMEQNGQIAAAKVPTLDLLERNWINSMN